MSEPRRLLEEDGGSEEVVNGTPALQVAERMNDMLEIPQQEQSVG